MDQSKKIKGFLFFDMDETLGFFRNYDGSMNNQGFPDGIYLRPGIKNLLKFLKQNFIVSVSTAATSNYTRLVLEQSGLLKYFDNVFTRDQFVKLENSSENDNEASPNGFEKRYSILMDYFNIKPELATMGMVIGDNDYDISSDVPELSTLIVDSLFTPTDVILAIIVDYFNNNEMDYSELGIEVKKYPKKHPISGIESHCIEVAIPKSLYHSELEKIDVKLIKKNILTKRELSKSQRERIQKPYTPAIQLKANRYGLI